MSERITAEPTIPESPAPASSPIKITCPKCTGTGRHDNGGSCYRCVGKGWLSGADLNRNAKYDVATGKIRWVVVLSRGIAGARRTAEKAFGDKTEVFVRDDQTTADGTRRAVLPKDLKPGMVAVVGHRETGELLEAMVEAVKDPQPVGPAF